MENARAKGGLTLGSSIFAVEVSVCWPYPGRGVQFAASPGRRTLQSGFSTGGGAGHRLTLVWPSGARRLDKKNRSVAQNLLILGSCFDRRDVLGPDRNQVGGGRSQALLTVRWNGQSCATPGSAVSMIVVEWGGHGPWAMGHGRGRSDGTAP